MEELIERAAKDLVNAKYAVALTGAGISTESGIHDFRGPDGIWTRHPEAEMEAYEAYDKLLLDPKGHWEQMLTPGSFFSLFDEIGNALPNRGHRPHSGCSEDGDYPECGRPSSEGGQPERDRVPWGPHQAEMHVLWFEVWPERV